MNWIYNYTLKYLVDAITAPILAKLTTLETAMHEDFEALRVRMDAPTSAISARLQTLLDELKGGVSADEAKQLLAEYTPLVEQLEAMGKDPVNPVP